MLNGGLRVLTNPCANLRWKGMFIDAEPDDSAPASNTRSYWCVYTQNCLGPDGSVADEDTCTISRSCFETM